MFVCTFDISSLRLLLLAAVASYALAETKHFTTSDGYDYAYDYVPAENAQPTVLLIHGFPSGRNDWHHQIDNLTAAGFGILAPDSLGYGDSDKPLDVEAYNMKNLAGHIAAILDNEVLDTVVGVGHDWGASLLSNAAVYHPERFEKLAFLAVPYSPPGPIDIDAINAASLQEVGYTRYGYWYFFNTYDAADVLHDHLESLFSLVFPLEPSTWRKNLAQLGGARAWLQANTTTALPAYLTAADRTEWLHRYGTKDAHTASLNYYRSVFAGVQVADAADLAFDDLLLEVPVLTVAGSQDAVASVEEFRAATQPFAVAGYTEEVVDAGHWLMLEQPEEMNAILSGFATRGA